MGGGTEDFMQLLVQLISNHTPGGMEAAGPYQGGQTMSAELIAIIVEMILAIAKLIEAIANT